MPPHINIRIRVTLPHTDRSTIIIIKAQWQTGIILRLFGRWWLVQRKKNVYAKPCTIRTMHVLRMLTRYCYQSGMCSAMYLLVMALVRRSNAYITHKIKRCLYIICACSSMVILGRRWMGLNGTNNAEELYECAVVWKCVCMALFLISLATAYWSSAKAWQRHRWYTYMTGEDTNSNWHICIALLPSIRLRPPLERVLVGLP